MCIVNPFDLLYKIKKIKLSLENKNVKWGEINNKCFFLKYMLYTITGAPIEKNSKIYQIYSHSYSQFWAHQCDYEHEIIQPWLPISQKYK